MSSEIKGVGGRILPGRTPGTQPESADPAEARTRSTAAAPGVKVSLTDTMARLQSVLSRLEDAPIVDVGRVDALRNSLARGEYRIDDQRVSEKLLALERQLESGGSVDER